MPKVSVCVACYNQSKFLKDLLKSILSQEHDDIEIILLDDASTDGTSHFENFPFLKYYKSETPSGTGGAFNKAISHATGDIVVLMCADDLFTDNHVISDIVKAFVDVPEIVHVSRYYHQFIDGDSRPVRGWRTEDVIELANNPSGLAFRKEAIGSCELSNKMFIEASSFVRCVLKRGSYRILKYDTVAVRIHQSISQNKNYYLKMWSSSPVEEWYKVGGISLLKDYTSLIQIKNNFRTSAVLKECYNFIKYRPMNLLSISFWFYAFVSIFTPRFILRKLPDFYRRTIGRTFTKEMKRCLK